MEEQIQANLSSDNVAVLNVSGTGERSSGDSFEKQQQHPATYGPFHRVRSPTQSDGTAELQVQSQEIWGRPRRGSDIPQVQSYVGPLPGGPQKGIEFYTNVPPDTNLPPGQARWTGPRPGVIIKDDFARISVVITKNTQIIEPPSETVEKSNGILVDEKEEEEEEYVMVA